MTTTRPADDQRRQLLAVLRDAGERPITLAELVSQGFAKPASALYELELAGYRLERVHAASSGGGQRLVGFRLREVEVAAHRAARRPASAWAHLSLRRRARE